jgi:hypothetical protein
MTMNNNSIDPSDPRILWKEAEYSFDRMSPVEKAQTLVTAGLFTAKLKPRKEYRSLFRRRATSRG